MSQTSFLESVVTWNQNQCKDNVQEALPRLVSQLAETNVSEEELGICKIICELFLPWVKIKDVERTVFIHITAKACSIMDKVLVGIADLCRQTSVQTEVQALLEIFVEVLDCYAACFKYVQSEGGNSPHISTVHSLPYGAVHLLKGAYSHCKESGNIYGEFLPSVTDLLSSLFKKAHGLQMALLGMLEKISVDSQVTEDEVEDLCFICQGLFEVCQTVTSLDAKLVCSLWKTISRFSGRHSNHVKNDLDVDRMIVFLCDEIKSGYLYLFQLAPPKVEAMEMTLSQGDNAAFQKSIKVLSYQMRIMISLLDSFIDHVCQCEQDIFQLILCIYRNLPPCLEAPCVSEVHVEEIQRQILNGTEPLLALLIRKQTFMECVTSKDKDVVGEEDQLPFLLMVIKIIDCLLKQTENVIDKWMSPKLYQGDLQRDGLLEVIFTTVDKCYVEMSLTNPEEVTLTTDKHRSMSLYQYVCTHVCGLMGSLRARHFATLETCLINHLLSQNMYVSTLVMDVWCFMARFGSADLCFKQTRLLLQLCSRPELQFIESSHPIACLAGRLIKFLAPDHQLELMKVFPLEHNPWLYGIVPTSIFQEPHRQEIVGQLTDLLVTSVQQFVNSAETTLGDVESLISIFQSVNKCLSGAENSECDISPNHGTSLGNCLGQMWVVWQKDWAKISILRILFTEVLDTTGSCLQYILEDVFVKIFDLLTDTISDEARNSSIKMAAIQFLIKCRSFRFPPNAQQSHILKRIPQLFQKLLNDKDVLIHHVAVDAFTQFAEKTMYEEIVPHCLGDSQYLQDAVVSFLNKKPSIETNFAQREHLKKQRLAVRKQKRNSTKSSDNVGRDVTTLNGGRDQDICNGKTLTEETPIEGQGDMLDDITFDGTEPSSKRKRLLEDKTKNGADEIIEVLGRKLGDLEAFPRSSLTSENVDKLRLLHTRLKNLLDS